MSDRNGTIPGVALHLDSEALRPLVRAIAAEVVAELEKSRAALGDRLAYSEDEAARLLGLDSWQLRDERRRGRIKASSIVGRRIRYAREDLTAYLLGRRWQGD